MAVVTLNKAPHEHSRTDRSLALECVGVRVQYGGFVVLESVDLKVPTGSVLGIAGPNGAGKTTLFDAITGRIKVTGGRIRLMDKDISALPAFRRARAGIARTYQAPLVPTEMTVGETLAAARLSFGPAIPQDAVATVRELVGFDQPASRRTGELDTLARRRLLLSCLMMRHPNVLLLDEPCSGLEQSEIKEMESVISRIMDKSNISVVVVEHRLEFLYSLAERVVVLHEGRVVGDGPPKEVFEMPVVREAYFEAPRGG